MFFLKGIMHPVYCVLFLGSSLLLLSSVQDVAAEQGIVLVIFSQPNKYHISKAELLKQNIEEQKELLNNHQTSVYLLHEHFVGVLGAWTVFPLLDRLVTLHNGSWVFLCEDVTQIDLRKLINIISSLDPMKDYFLGHALKDSQPTIIHHFAGTEGSSTILYPDTSAGFFISPSLLKKSAVRWYTNKIVEFTIDPRYELAKFFWDEARGVKLLDVPGLCLSKVTDDCATWVNETEPNCGQSVPKENIYFAVKTCQMYHRNRVPVVKNTWAKDCSFISFFSDEEDFSIPTINIGIKNVPSGHCEKTLSILKFIVDHDIPAEWVIIADDDTLLSVPRLRKLLACFDASDHVALGERYGYGAAAQQGYDYITGGGGMAFSMPTVKKITSSSYCKCPSVDSPDDMILGICLRNLDIPIIHSNYFHQARPEDYSSEYLSHQKPISFHKHWMIDPYDVYKTWLEENNPYVSADIHNEL